MWWAIAGMILLPFLVAFAGGGDKSPPHPKGGTERFPWYNEDGTMTVWHPDATR